MIRNNKQVEQQDNWFTSKNNIPGNKEEKKNNKEMNKMNSP